MPRTDVRLLGLRTAQRGQGTIEYVGLVVVVAAIVGALVATGAGPTIAQGLSTQVCRITGGSNCGGGGGGDSEAVGEEDDSGAGDPVDGTTSDTGGTGGTGDGGDGDPGDPGEADPGDPGGEKPQTQIDYEAALKELQDAQAAEKTDSDKAKEAAKELAKILADELGITDALDCITKGDMGACTETLVNVLTSLIGGAVGKLAAKYGAPWKWKKAAELVGKLKKHGGDLYDGIKGLIKNRKRVSEAEDRLADAKRKLDAENKGKPKDGEEQPDKKPTACPVTHSFLPGTPVLLADGSRAAIEDVRVGDRVLATDPARGLTVARAVTDTITTEDDKDFTRLTVRAAGRTATLTATDTHPFWLMDEDRWADAGEITAGDELRAPDGGELTVVAVDRFVKKQRTHDLTVSGVHTYYVGVGRTHVLVHNNDPDECKRQKREAQERKRMSKKLDEVMESARDGKFRKKVDGDDPRKSYHGRLDDEKVLDILSNPDEIYISEGQRGAIMFYKDGNIVILDGQKATIGQAVTAFGKDGPRGTSGAKIFGGSPDDPGMPITPEMIEEGRIPNTTGGFNPPGKKFKR
ncbi:polymorphic toxin-type HINT domain-containing protein [Streptomyces sp. NPDC002018]|uniref:polymorphic toxin-type HINT domain-containing protein n=1 Tax=Streptomyces sp. NPDC002018 TaxID=3364629 RepID=UPI0036914789